jgi:tetratricopeptide (TPR) repeat protein
MGLGFPLMYEFDRITQPARPLSQLRWNWPVFIASWVLILLVAPSLYFFHRSQKVKLSDSFLQSAEMHKENKEWVQAINDLEVYLGYHEEDVARRIELAELYDQAATDFLSIQGGISQLSTAIGLCESSPAFRDKLPSLRRKLINRQMEVGLYNEALQQIAKAAGPEPNAEIERLLALTRYNLAVDKRNDRWDESAQSLAPEWIWPLGNMAAVDLLLRALSSNPGDEELTGALAYVILDAPELCINTQLAAVPEPERRERLRVWNETMLASHNDQPTAWLAHYAIADQLNPAESEANITRALDRFPDNVGVLRTASEHYVQRAKTINRALDRPTHDAMVAKARTLIERVRERTQESATSDALIFATLGDIALEQGEPETAIQVWKDGILACPPPTSFLHFRTVKTLIQQRTLDRALKALNAMDESIRRESINVTLGDGTPGSDPAASISNVGKQLWTAYYIAQKDYASVTRVMNELANETERGPEVRAEFLATVGTSCMNSAQWDLAGTSYEQASMLVPSEPQYRRGAAEAWFQANRLSESLQQWQAIENKTTEDWFQIAATILSMQLQRFPDPELWNGFDNAMRRVQATSPNANGTSIAAWRIELLRLESAVAKTSVEQRNQAIDSSVPMLLALSETDPNNRELHRRVSNLLQSWLRSEDASRLAVEFRRNNPDSSEAVVERAKTLAQQGNTDEAKSLLFEQLNRQPQEDAILDALFSVDSTPQGHSLCLEKLKPWCGRDLGRLIRVANIALQLPILSGAADRGNSNRWKRDVERWSQPVRELEIQIRDIEGPNGTEWRWLQARRLLAIAAIDPNLDLEPVAAIVRTLETGRPLWASTHTLAGLLAEQQRDPTKAIKAYQKASALGETDPMVYEKWIALLLREGLIAEAQELIRSLGQRGNRLTSIAGAAMELAINNEMELMSLARSGVETRPNDPMAWVWYAQFLDASTRLLNDDQRSKQLPTIEAALDKAEQLSGGGEIRVFNAAYDFYTVTEQTEKRNAMLQRIRASTALAPDVQWLFLAIAQQTQGNLEMAESYYRVALQSGGDPKEIGILLAKLFFNQGKIEASIDQLEQLQKTYLRDSTIRESLALMLAVRGSPTDWDRLQKLLTDAEFGNTPEDRRTLSKLLIRRGSTEDVERARTILESLALNPGERTDEDSSRLASIYVTRASELPDSSTASNQRERWLKLADEQLKLTAMGNLPKPEYLFAYGAFLLDQQRTKEVSPILKRLSGLAPDSSNAMLLRARWLAADGQPDAARDGVLDWLATQRQQLDANANAALEDQLLAKAVNALYWIDDTSAAEKIMSELTQRNEAVANLLWLTLCESPKPQVRNAALLAILERSGNPTSRELAFRICRFLAIQSFRPEVLADAQKLLVQFETDHPEDAEFRIYLADHWISQNNRNAAIAALRAAVALEPENVFALNNLANLLGELPETTQEALSHIDTALRIVGQRPELLDSKATILMTAGDFDAAIPLLQLAASNGTDPRFNLHWYIALKQAGRTEEAKKLIPTIDFNALRVTHLSPMDTQELDFLTSTSSSL